MPYDLPVMLAQYLHGVVALAAVHSGLQRHNHSLRQDDVAAFPVREADFGERKQLFRRIFDQPRRFHAAPEPERNPLDPTPNF